MQMRSQGHSSCLIGALIATACNVRLPTKAPLCVCTCWVGRTQVAGSYIDVKRHQPDWDLKNGKFLFNEVSGPSSTVGRPSRLHTDDTTHMLWSDST